MVTSRNPKIPASPAADAFDEVLSVIATASVTPSLPAAVSTTRPHSTRHAASHAVPPPPPSTARSAPASSSLQLVPSSGKQTGECLIGYIAEKVSLFRYGGSKVGHICGGIIGGVRGNRLRFCLKAVFDESVPHCGDPKHAFKFCLEVNTYYVPMKDETAVCWPHVSLADLN
jgi:hypothetical protein